MLDMSKHICDQTGLLTLGVQVLGLAYHDVISAQTDSVQINAAAYKLLQSWYQQQNSAQEACQILHTRLREVNWNQLAHILVDGVKPSSTLSESKALLMI